MPWACWKIRAQSEEGYEAPNAGYKLYITKCKCNSVSKAPCKGPSRARETKWQDCLIKQVWKETQI